MTHTLKNKNLDDILNSLIKKKMLEQVAMTLGIECQQNLLRGASIEPGREKNSWLIKG